MLIRTASPLYHKNDNESELREAGIREAKRIIILFIKRYEYDNNLPLTNGLAFQVNLSISDNRNIMRRAFTGNVSSIRMNVYNYDVSFEIGGLKDINSAVFALRTAFGSELENDYNSSNTRLHEVNMFDKALNTSEDFSNAASNLFVDTPVLVPPQYYSQEHMFSDMGDFNDISWDPFSQIYTGMELFDHNTEIKVMDYSAWDTVKHSLEEMDRNIRINDDLVDSSLDG